VVHSSGLVGDQKYKDEGSRLCGADGMNETWMATIEIAEASVGLDHSQDTLYFSCLG